MIFLLLCLSGSEGSSLPSGSFPCATMGGLLLKGDMDIGTTCRLPIDESQPLSEQ